MILFLFTLPLGCVHAADSRVSTGRCDHWCPEALVTHDPKTVCTLWGPPCLGCQECRCDAWCPEALVNGQHDPSAVCTTWKQCTGCTECFDLRAAPKPKPCEAKPCKNAAVCVDNADGSFKCECTPGYVLIFLFFGERTRSYSSFYIFDLISSFFVFCFCSLSSLLFLLNLDSKERTAKRTRTTAEMMRATTEANVSTR